MTTSRSDAAALIACLGGLAMALMVVGVVSGTVLRHVVQIVPAILAAVVIWRRQAAGAYAAMAIFIFWILIVVLIWLFLAGLSRIANGQYTLAEVICTVVMGLCCGYGAVRAIPIGRPATIASRALAFGAFAVLQVAAMWISFSPSIANR